MYVPTKLFFTKGVGTHREKLTSFELALRDARIACYNLVRVSSIFPPNCKEISIDEGLKQLQPGQIVHVVMSESATAEPNRLVAASVGVAIPRDRSLFGYLSEHHAYGQTAKTAADYAEDLAAEMLATVLGRRIQPRQLVGREARDLENRRRLLQDQGSHPDRRRPQGRPVDHRRGRRHPPALTGRAKHAGRRESANSTDRRRAQ